MSEAAPQFDGVVNEDGSLTVSPDQLATLGLQPGSHLRLVPAQRRSLTEILNEEASWQQAQGIELSEEEAQRVAVEASRSVRDRLNDQASKGA